MQGKHDIQSVICLCVEFDTKERDKKSNKLVKKQQIGKRIADKVGWF